MFALLYISVYSTLNHFLHYAWLLTEVALFNFGSCWIQLWIILGCLCVSTLVKSDSNLLTLAVVWWSLGQHKVYLILCWFPCSVSLPWSQFVDSQTAGCFTGSGSSLPVTRAILFHISQNRWRMQKLIIHNMYLSDDLFH